MNDFHLETERLIIRNWCNDDRELFHFINSDETVMKFFPFRRNREEADQLMDKLTKAIKRDGHGFTAVELRKTGECIGFCGLHRCEMEVVRPLGAIEIGWRLSPEFWGKGYVTECATRLLDFGFKDLNLPEIVSFAVKDNQRSLNVMERIGLKRDPSRDFDLQDVPDQFAHLKPHSFYCLENPEKKGA